MNADPKLLERAAKLKALAESPNEHEAANALAALHRLALKHKIEVAGLACHDLGSEFAVCDEQPVFTARRPAAWKVDLLLVLAQYNGCCEYHAIRGRDKAYMLAGRQQDIDHVRFLWAQTVVVLSRLASKRLPSQRKRADWLLGAVKGIEDQLRRAHRKVRQESKASSAMTVIDNRPNLAVQAIEKLAGGAPRLEAPCRGRDRASYTDGLGVGRKLNLGLGRPLKQA
jgi:hypothetical protein